MSGIRRGIKGMLVRDSLEALCCVLVVAQWLAHLPLVLEVPGSIATHGKENFGVGTRFL